MCSYPSTIAQSGGSSTLSILASDDASNSEEEDMQISIPNVRNQMVTLDDDEDIPISISKIRKTTLDSDDECDDNVFEVKSCKSDSHTKSKYILKTLPRVITKTEDDAIPLPDPFELPKNYRPDVESALKSGKMTLDTNKAFLSTVAACMFSYKKYPTSDDYNNVARTIVQKYPFMKSPIGKPYVICVS